MPDDLKHLETAVTRDRADIIKSFLENGGSPDTCPDEDSLLILSIYRNAEKVFTALLEKGADINKTGLNGDTPLIVAATFGRKEMVMALIEKEAALDIRNSDGNMAVDCAADNDHIEVVQMLLDAADGKLISLRIKEEQLTAEAHAATSRKQQLLKKRAYKHTPGA